MAILAALILVFLILTLIMCVCDFADFKHKAELRDQQEEAKLKAFATTLADSLTSDPAARAHLIFGFTQWVRLYRCDKRGLLERASKCAKSKSDYESAFAKYGISPEPFRELLGDPSITFVRKRQPLPYGPFKRRLALAEATR